MKKLYKYLAVAACALLGAGSASAEMYVLTYDGSSWTNHPMKETSANTYTYGANFTTGNLVLFQTENRSQPNWNTTNNYISESTNDGNYWITESGKTVNCYLNNRRCFEFNNTNGFQEGYYLLTLTYHDNKYTATFVYDENGGQGGGGDITLDDHTAYATVPQITDLMLSYWVGNQKSHINSKKKIVFGEEEHSVAELYSGTKYGWAKYEDMSDYESWMQEVGDTYEVDTNETMEHDCKNFNDAYYRFYQYTLDGRPALMYDKNKTAATTGRRAPRVVPEQGVQHSRVARTFPMKDNTTGVDDIITDGGESVEDTDAPVIWYNLQGQRVNNPSNGVFIRQQGSKVTKEYIR